MPDLAGGGYDASAQAQQPQGSPSAPKFDEKKEQELRGLITKLRASLMCLPAEEESAPPLAEIRQMLQVQLEAARDALRGMKPTDVKLKKTKEHIEARTARLETVQAQMAKLRKEEECLRIDVGDGGLHIGNNTQYLDPQKSMQAAQVVVPTVECYSIAEGDEQDYEDFEFFPEFDGLKVAHNATKNPEEFEDEPSTGIKFADIQDGIACISIEHAPIAAFEHAGGVQDPVRLWNPDGFTAIGNVAHSQCRRKTELKHGRSSSSATPGHITSERVGKLPADLLPAMGIKRVDVPSGFMASGISEAKATANDIESGGEDPDSRVADFRMRDFKRKNRGKDVVSMGDITYEAATVVLAQRVVEDIFVPQM